jgi:hypothetical protein
MAQPALSAARARPSAVGVFVVAFVATTVLGVALIVGGQPSPLATLTNAQAMGSVAGVALFTVVPLGLPTALVGAWLASRVLARASRGQPWTFWAWRGAAIGASVGAAWTSLWFGALAIHGADRVAATILVAAAGGAVAGALVGLAAGTWCWRVARA